MRLLLLLLALGAAGCRPEPPPLASLTCGTPSFRPIGWPSIYVRPVGRDTLRTIDWAAVADSIPYPEFARRAWLEDTVPMDVVVGPDGAAVAVEAVGFPDGAPAPTRLLEEAAEDGLARARYLPAPEADARIRVHVRFSLLRDRPDA